MIVSAEKETIIETRLSTGKYRLKIVYGASGDFSGAEIAVGTSLQRLNAEGINENHPDLTASTRTIANRAFNEILGNDLLQPKDKQMAAPLKTAIEKAQAIFTPV